MIAFIALIQVNPFFVRNPCPSAFAQGLGCSHLSIPKEASLTPREKRWEAGNHMGTHIHVRVRPSCSSRLCRTPAALLLLHHAQLRGWSPQVPTRHLAPVEAAPDVSEGSGSWTGRCCHRLSRTARGAAGSSHAEAVNGTGGSSLHHVLF